MTDFLYDNPQHFRDLSAQERRASVEWARLWHAEGDVDALHAFAEAHAIPRPLFRPATDDCPAHYRVTPFVVQQLAARRRVRKSSVSAWRLAQREQEAAG